MTDIEELQDKFAVLQSQVLTLARPVEILQALVEKHDRDIESLQTAIGV